MCGALWKQDASNWYYIAFCYSVTYLQDSHSDSCSSPRILQVACISNISPRKQHYHVAHRTHFKLTRPLVPEVYYVLTGGLVNPFRDLNGFSVEVPVNDVGEGFKSGHLEFTERDIAYHSWRATIDLKFKRAWYLELDADTCVVLLPSKCVVTAIRSVIPMRRYSSEVTSFSLSSMRMPAFLRQESNFLPRKC